MSLGEILGIGMRLRAALALLPRARRRLWVAAMEAEGRFAAIHRSCRLAARGLLRRERSARALDWPRRGELSALVGKARASQAQLLDALCRLHEDWEVWPSEEQWEEMEHPPCDLLDLLSGDPPRTDPC